MKKSLLLFSLLFLAACSSDTETSTEKVENTEAKTTVTTEQPTTKTEDEITEEAPEMDDEAFEFPEGSEQFVALLDDMRSWTNFYSNFSYLENFADEDAIDTELYEQTHFINQPREVLKSNHYIGFSNQMYEHYANEADGLFTNDQMMGWEKSVESIDILKDPIPSRIELLKTLLSNSVDFHTTGGDYYNGVRFEIQEDALETSYFKMQTALFYDVVEAEVDESIIQAINAEPIDVTMILVEVHELDARFGEYIIQVFFTEDDGLTENEFIFTETFEIINTLTEIPIPDELSPLL